MRKRHFVSVLALMPVLGWSATAAAAPNAQAILAASDAIRYPGYPFSLTTTLTEYRDGLQIDVNSLDVYSKADKDGGQFSSLIRFVSPARDANKLLLKSGNDLWFYDPASKASIRISPQQRVLGQATNGDVVSVNLAKDYQATLVGTEEIIDGDKHKRNAYKLLLAATNSSVTYHHIEIWLDTTNNRPLRARFYSESNRLLKTAYFRKYDQVLGAERPTEVVIIDGLNSKWVTIMHYSNWAKRNVPDAWLQRDYLPRFKPE